jgi:predicted nucleic acid-binding protein
MYLLDTNVISELRKPRPHGGVVAWVTAVDEVHLFLSAVTVAEIQAGIEVTRDQDETKAAEIDA